MPQSRDDRIERAVQRIVSRIDTTRPYAHQLEQVATVAVGYGLRRASDWQAAEHGATAGLRAKMAPI